MVNTNFAVSLLLCNRVLLMSIWNHVIWILTYMQRMSSQC